jgi:hypothetical protein
VAPVKNIAFLVNGDYISPRMNVIFIQVFIYVIAVMLSINFRQENLIYLLTLFILARHTSKLNYRITVNTDQCDSILYIFIAFTCFDQLMKFRWHKIYMFGNYYYKIWITNFVIVIPEHADLMPSEDGQLTETCKSNKYIHNWITLDGVNSYSLI